MGRSASTALLFLGLILMPITASAAQIVLSDGTINHTATTGARISVGTSGAPADLTAPDDYAQGTLHHRVMVTTAQTNATNYAVCFVQGAQSACSTTPIAITGTGTFEATQTIVTLSNYGNIQWNMPLDDIEVVAMDTAGVPVDALETTWIGYPDLTLYYPLDLTYQAVVVANGDAFEGYPGMAGNMAEAPALAPNGGTFEGSVDVSLATGSADSTIYYTTDGSTPDDSSTAYDGTPINITTTTTVQAITYAAGLAPSTVTAATFEIVDALSNGLRGRYYNSTDFEELQLTRTDPVINFEYADGAPPAPDLGGSYSILWSGQVTPRYTDTYTFKTVNDDGVRLWVDNRLVIDDWNAHGPEERSGTVSLTADQPVSIWLEYYNGGGGGTISLSWESPQQPAELIPDTAMVPDLPAGTRATVSLFGGDELEFYETETEAIRLPIRRRGNIDEALNVRLSLTGTATNGDDYMLAGGTITFGIPAGAFEGTVELTLNNDDLVEGVEEIILTIAEDAGYVVGDPNSATISILDDDVQVDSLSGTITYTGTESGKIIVEAFRETDPVFAKRRISLLNAGEYTFNDLEEGDYTVIAYVDSDDDEQLDEDEIWGIYQDENLQPALVSIPPGQIGIDINLDVPPGEDGGEEDDGGCCATVSKRSGTSGWLALLLGVVVVALRRKHR